MISFCRCRDLLIVAAAAHPAATAAGLGLRIIAFEGLGLDEVNVRLGGVARILGLGVNAHQIAGRQLVVFERQNIFAVGCFDAFLRQQLHGLLRSAIHRIMQRDLVQPEIVIGIHRDGDFFDRIDFGVAARTVDLDGRRVILARFDEEIFAQTDILSPVDSRDVIEAVFLQRYRSGLPVALGRLFSSICLSSPSTGCPW